MVQVMTNHEKISINWDTSTIAQGDYSIRQKMNWTCYCTDRG